MKDRPVVLISAVCGDIGGGAVRALREASLRIIGCDMKEGCPVSNVLDAFFKAPAASNQDNYLSFVKEIIRKEKVDAFLPISEPEIEALSERRDDVESTGVSLLLNNRLIIENFIDKLKMIRFLNGLGVKVPKTMPLSTYDGTFDFPIIIKPRKGYGSKRLWQIEDEFDLAYVKRKDDGFLIAQEYVGCSDEEYTTGVFSDGNNISSITFRRRLGFGGLSVEAEYAESPFLDELAAKIAIATNLCGSINIQSRRIKENLFVPFEINPRLSSTLSLRKYFGFDDAVWWLDALWGKGYHYEKKFKAGKMVRFVSDYYFEMEKFVKNVE
ncbi:MAG: ATP-grasp domain-containing protein [Deltaproteobacteria bacterium]|nr:ATP-grasp domain-containing protein [Deltaproteobacteria bacterium]